MVIIGPHMDISSNNNIYHCILSQLMAVSRIVPVWYPLNTHRSSVRRGIGSGVGLFLLESLILLPLVVTDGSNENRGKMMLCPKGEIPCLQTPTP